MVFVAVPESAVQGTGADDQAVVRLGHVSAERGDLRDEGRQPIRFVTAQVCDSGEYRLALGKGSQGGDGRRQFARIIEADAAQAVCPGHRQLAQTVPRLDERYLAAHVGEDSGHLRPDLGRVGRPTGDRDRAAGDERGAEKRPGIGEVGFDRNVDAGDRTGRNDPDPGLGVLHHHPAAGEGGDGHVDMGETRQPVSDVPERKPVREASAGQEQAGDELARRGGIDLDLSARDGARGVQAEREFSPAVVADIHPKGTQRIDRGAHRALAGRFVTVESDRTERERGDRREETHDSAGQAAVDGGASGELAGGDQQVGSKGRDSWHFDDARAECPKRLDHEGGVARVQRCPQDRRSARDRGEHQLAVGQRFRSGQREPGR